MFGNIVLRQNLLSHIVGGLVSQRDMGMCGGVVGSGWVWWGAGVAEFAHYCV